MGLAIAFAGVVLAFSESFGHSSSDQLHGDALALAAGVLWGLTTLTLRTTRLATASAEKALFYQIAFTAAVVGGIGNLRGAVLGGLVIGCIQQMADNRIGSEWTPAVVFAYLVLIMVVRPRGLLGEETREAG